MLKLLAFGLLAGGIADLATHLVTPFVAQAARAARVVEYPTARRIQRRPVPRLGGLALAVGLVLAAGAVSLARWTEWGGRVEGGDLLAFGFSTALVFLVGFADDIYGAALWRRLAMVLMASSVVVLAGWRFTAIGVPFGGTVDLGVAGPVLTVAWIAGVTVVVGLIDGLDGLAGGVVAVIAATLMVYGALQGNVFTVILMGAVTGACAAFLRWNARGEILMGSSGSLTLGFILGAMTVHASLKAPAAVAVLAPILALGVPVMDAVFVVAERILRRPRGYLGRRTGRVLGGAGHVHHLLAEWVPGRTVAVWGMYALVVASCLAAMIVVVRESAELGAVLVFLEAVVVAGLRRAGYAARARAQARARRRAACDLVQTESGSMAVVGDDGVLSFAGRDGGPVDLVEG